MVRSPRAFRLRRGSPLLVGGLVFALLVLAGSIALTLAVIASRRPAAVAQASVTPLPTLPATETSLPRPSETPPPPTSTPMPTEAPPSATPTVWLYIVVSGDTLTDIAARFGVTVEAIKLANGLLNDTIYAGDTLIIPVGGAATAGTQLPPAATTAVEGTLSSSGSITPTETAAAVEHFVQPGETLDSIAALYGLTAQDLRFANFMVGDAILPGQRLNLPPGPMTTAAPFNFSILEGNLAAAYPLSFDTERFTLHFAGQSLASVDPEAAAGLVSNGLAHIETVFQTPLAGRFDVYSAGSVFEPPNRALRGRSFSLNRYYFFLHDGSGNAADQQYIATHELTHLYTWNVFGQPVSTMLSEGAAVYAGMGLISGAGHLPLDAFCAAYLQAGQLPMVSGSLGFGGHNLDLENYYAAGCFVGYLVETYGPGMFGQLYPTGDYAGIYGKPLAALEQDWRAALATAAVPPGLDAAALTATVEDVEAAFLSFFSAFTGTSKQILAYRELDLARLAMLEGRLSDAEVQLAKYREALNAP